MKCVAYFFLVFLCVMPLSSLAQQTDYNVTEINVINNLKQLLSATKLNTKKITQDLNSLLLLVKNLGKKLTAELSKARSGDFTENIEEQATKHMQILWDIELQLLDIASPGYEDKKEEILKLIRKAEIKYFKTFFAIVWSSSPVGSATTKQKIINSLEINLSGLKAAVLIKDFY